ncbi:uncharacterized protein LOC117569182 [Drosophila albomicans]|uniref:Uncharacterized protein LOC117569182 n=1 Tax=Drosophila albomicans TaxID=7291 RepID=A0A6P8WQW0_DROAB|nr:uncharacterized protein LOC117569182 [Drosophila albomicans]
MDITSAASIYLHQLGERRPRISDLNASIFPNGGPEPSSLVEISGNRKSGKTLLLMQLVAHCLTRCDVVLLNTSNKIDSQLFGKLLKDAIKASNPNSTTAELEKKFEACMESLEIVNCFSSAQLEMALRALDHYMLLENERISLIAVDSLCEFYWLDLGPEERQRKYTYYMYSLNNLRKICNKFYVSCMYTIDSSFNKNAYESSRSIAVDHKLHLAHFTTGVRTLNNKNILISDKGVEADDENK